MKKNGKSTCISALTLKCGKVQPIIWQHMQILENSLNNALEEALDHFAYFAYVAYIEPLENAW